MTQGPHDGFSVRHAGLAARLAKRVTPMTIEHRRRCRFRVLTTGRRSASGTVEFAGQIGMDKNRILKRRSPRTDGQAGFTLLELLVVIVILGLLIGLVAPAVLRQLGHAKDQIATQSIARLGAVLDMYKLDVGSYPTTDQGLQALGVQPADVAAWNGPYLKGSTAPLDPWGHPFLYQSPSSRPNLDYDLCSLGSADKQGAPGDPGLICNK
jgi:general secretion pathway protein G